MVLCEDLPQKTSVHAAEGTRAHKMAEDWLLGRFTPTGDKAAKEMEENVKVYVDHAHELKAAHRGCSIEVEAKVTVLPACWGTADLMVWAPASATLFVRDLKYGAGIPVDVSHNRQLMTYGLGALLTTKLPAEIIDIGIVQPRYNHPDGFIRSKEYDAVDLLDHFADIKAAQALITEAFLYWDMPDYPRQKWETTYLHPTKKGCKWCLAAPTCPRIKAMAQESAKLAFAKGTPYDPAALAEALDFIPIIKAWCKTTDEFAYAEAAAGRPAPGFKLVAKKASRKWVEFPNDVMMAIACNRPVAELYKPRELRPIGEILAMCPGKNQEERDAIVAPYTTKESAGYALVHVDDSRPAVALDAKSAFGEIVA